MNRKTVIFIYTKDNILVFNQYSKLILYIKQFYTNFILPFNITMPKHSQIEKLDSSRNNCQSFDSTCDKICVENGRFFHFKNDGKLYHYYILKRMYPVIKNNF